MDSPVSYNQIFDPAIYNKVVEAYVAKLPGYMALNHPTVEAYALGGSGFSGSLVAMGVAARLSLPVWIVRKEQSHSGNLGYLERGGPYDFKGPWVFVDDFISSGATLQRCIKAIGTDPIDIILYAAWELGPGAVSIWEI